MAEIIPPELGEMIPFDGELDRLLAITGRCTFKDGKLVSFVPTYRYVAATRKGDHKPLVFAADAMTEEVGWLLTYK
jgi:hypothetical protein